MTVVYKAIVVIGCVLIAGLLLSGLFMYFKESQRYNKFKAAEQVFSDATTAMRTDSFEQALEMLDRASQLLPASQPRVAEEDLQTQIELAKKQIDERATLARLEREKREAQERLEREKVEQAKLEAESRQREERQVLVKAREMYGAYKQSAETVANEMLKVLSATEVGITYNKYTEMLHALQFECNKFSMRCADVEKEYCSYVALLMAIEQLKGAGEWWKLKIKYPTSDTGETEKELQHCWSVAGKCYTRAMACMADVESPLSSSEVRKLLDQLGK